MAGITITGVKVVGLCSKCRKEEDDIPIYKNGTIVPDKNISCISKAFGDCVGDADVGGNK